MTTKKLASNVRKTTKKTTAKTTKKSNPEVEKDAPYTSKRVLKARQDQLALMTFLNKKLDPKLSEQVATKLNKIFALYEQDIAAFSTALESTGELMTSYGQHVEDYAREIMDISTRISSVFKK